MLSRSAVGLFAGFGLVWGCGDTPEASSPLDAADTRTADVAAPSDIATADMSVAEADAMDTSDIRAPDLDAADCPEDCDIGEKRCGADGIEVCVGGDVPSCGAWTPVFSCPADSACNDGVCVPTCSDTCPGLGTTTCDGGGFRTCNDPDGDGCLAWSPVTACPQAETCSAGACGAACVDECADAGGWLCDGTSARRQCGQFDADACRDHGPIETCEAGARCSGGVCVASCSNDCSTTGEVDCVGSGARTCGQYDADACLEWGPTIACGAGSVCDESAGGCFDPCAGDCAIGESTCSGTTGYRVCAADPVSGCGETGLFAGCQTGNACSAGACTGTCAVPELVLLVDRSSSTAGATWTTISGGVLAYLDKYTALALHAVRQFPETGCLAGPILGPVQDQPGWFEGKLTPPSTNASTPIAAALRGVLADGDPREGRAAVIITDGTETCEGETEAIAAIQAIRKRGARVYTIGVGAGHDAAFLDRLATAGGTRQSRIAASAAALTAILRDIARAEGARCDDGTDGSVGVCNAGQCTSVCSEGTVACATGCCRFEHSVEPIRELTAAPGSLDVAVESTGVVVHVSAGSTIYRVKRGSLGWTSAVVDEVWDSNFFIARDGADRMLMSDHRPDSSTNYLRLLFGDQVWPGTSSRTVGQGVGRGVAYGNARQWVALSFWGSGASTSGLVLVTPTPSSPTANFNVALQASTFLLPAVQTPRSVFVNGAGELVFTAREGVDSTVGRVYESGLPSGWWDGASTVEPTPLALDGASGFALDGSDVPHLVGGTGQVMRHATLIGGQMRTTEIARHAEGVFGGTIVFDADGAPHVTYLSGTGINATRVAHYATMMGGAWTTVPIGPADWAAIDVNPDGGVLVVISRSTGTRWQLELHTMRHVAPTCDDCEPSGSVVINELRYDTPSTDDAVFVEIKGPPGTVLTGWKLVGVDGGGNGTHGVTTLVGAIPADGYFLVVDADTSDAALAALADQLGSVDYQNGPDSLQLQRPDGTVVDAVAWGTFAAGDTFAGEGTAATEPPSNSMQSLARIPDGADTGNNSNDFRTLSTATPGARN